VVNLSQLVHGTVRRLEGDVPSIPSAVRHLVLLRLVRTIFVALTPRLRKQAQKVTQDIVVYEAHQMKLIVRAALPPP